MSDRFADAGERYRLDSHIATGGMGEVWRATDTVLGRRVAVKVLKHEYADDRTFRIRFEQEARHAASLHHPGVASVFDFGEAAGEGSAPVPYLVMELVDGVPLADLLRAGEPMPPERARDLIRQSAEALAAAHAVGIVHRDVKPANLLVTPVGVVKITDFGIARAAESVALTGTSEVIGTPHYLSPEQASGKPATSASDVYALGVVLFECLAGRRPFQGENAVATALAHLREPVPDLPAGVPDDLAEVTRRALAKQPEDRFASAAELAAALEADAGAAAGGASTAGAGLAGAGLAGAGLAGAAGAAAAAPSTDEETPGTGPTDAGTAVLTQPPVPAGPQGPRRTWRDRLPGWWPVAAAAAAVLLVIALLAWVLGSPDPGATAAGRSSGSTQGQSGPSSAPASSAGGSPSHSVSQSASHDDRVRVRESRYVDQPKDQVKHELEQRGFHVEEAKRDNPGTEVPDTVAAVDPHGRVERGATLTMTVWDKVADLKPPKDTQGQDNGHDKADKGHGKAKGRDD